ncbi:hypothetical protein LguiA_035070 [Lonicera macranthoides]
MVSTSTACFLHYHPLFTQTISSSSSSSLPHFSTIIKPRPRQLICRAAQKPSDVQEDDATGAIMSRRLALTVLIGTAAVGSKVSPADAAYGEAANVFGKPKKNTDFLPYEGNGFKLLLPSKWNPSKEVEYPGQVLRYEDNFDTTTNVAVTVTPTNKKSITDFGPPEEFLSQGGFDPDAVATANILESSTPVIGGKPYYFLSVLTRTADGDEGGKHQLITATVKDGKLYTCKAQAGDKRWFKGARKFVENTANSFSVA